ncbi:ImmA/IrrE family metallo-endopeptidase [Blastococcus sp. TF02A-30]|uniref:ImmA/IrrE family metallo-endopeptidase n=1 Tax=Blastococcus sp. TF02A-30 TaxID=2250580 RepID=UPI0018F6BED3|nr:ImmA/IrrE family metallo-endopeptidase [Blastococcus sp. TF02A-30]
MRTRLRDAAKDAQDVLLNYWADETGRLAIPIDPIWIARELGIQVFVSDMDLDVSGTLRRSHGETVIDLNRSDAPVRQRFTCAHELGHFVYNTSGVEPASAFEFVDFRSTLAAAGVDPAEIYANRFAAALLMPEDEVRKRQHLGVPLSALSFNVSEQAMSLRWRSLGIA